MGGKGCTIEKVLKGVVAASYLLTFGLWGVRVRWEGPKKGLGVVQKVSKVMSTSLIHEDLVGGGWVVEVAGVSMGVKGALH